MFEFLKANAPALQGNSNPITVYLRKEDEGFEQNILTVKPTIAEAIEFVEKHQAEHFPYVTEWNWPMNGKEGDGGEWECSNPDLEFWYFIVDFTPMY
jgi:hypothetical protein